MKVFNQPMSPTEYKIPIGNQSAFPVKLRQVKKKKKKKNNDVQTQINDESSIISPSFGER